MNECIELHDSVLHSLAWTADGVVLTLNPAYIHRSMGRPGWDSGSGWLGCATIRISGAARSGAVELPVAVWDGTLQIGEEIYDNCLPTTGTYEAAILLHLEFVTAEKLKISGTSFIIQLEGECTHLEDFDGNQR